MSGLSERMHVEFLASAAHDGVFSRERMEEHWRILKGAHAKLDDELYEKAVARARILNTPADKKIDIASKNGISVDATLTAGQVLNIP